MELDLTQFRALFLEEAAELLDAAEAGLLSLDTSTDKAAVIDQVFGPIHSLKGTAGTLGFEEAAGLAHLTENLLNHIREGLQEPTPTVVDQLLTSVDSLRKILFKEEQPETLAQPVRQHSNAAASGPTQYVRVDASKLDTLVSMAGELVVAQAQFRQQAAQATNNRLLLDEYLHDLEVRAHQLQETSSSLRMLPARTVFARLDRVVREVTRKLNKPAKLVLQGEDTELDKAVLEKLQDPLTHLVRNAIGHGIESAQDRQAADKPESGQVKVSAHYQGCQAVVKVCDDGGGLDHDAILRKATERGLTQDRDLPPERVQDFLFQPGFSTAAQVDEVSGRGVGLDVVRKNVRKMGGEVEVSSIQGVGTTFTIRLPLSLAVLEGQLVRRGSEAYALPMRSIVETLEYVEERVVQASDGRLLYPIRNSQIPIVGLDQIFSYQATEKPSLLVVVSARNQRLGLMVDEILSQQSIVVKNLETHYQRVRGIFGATILGDGKVTLIVDAPGLMELFFEERAIAS